MWTTARQEEGGQGRSLPQHHAEYVEKTKAYKQDSREADRLSIADKEKQRSIIAEMDKQIEGKEELIDTLESEIRRRREHHHEYFGQGTSPRKRLPRR